VKENPVVIYMKGVPEMPRCGFSSLAVRILKEDMDLKEAVKAYRVYQNYLHHGKVIIKYALEEHFKFSGCSFEL